MSLLADDPTRAALAEHARPGRNTDFRFIPKELAEKCRHLIESYHDMHGYACLPDMLWQSGTQDLIESHREFNHIFKTAAKARVAKRANDGFVLIATIICALEVLTRDFAGWGARFPMAKRKAEVLVAEYLAKPRVWLIDRYLYPQRHINPAFINPLALSVSGDGGLEAH